LRWETDKEIRDLLLILFFELSICSSDFDLFYFFLLLFFVIQRFSRRLRVGNWLCDWIWACESESKESVVDSMMFFVLVLFFVDR
jgi:hypothetical protein